MAVGRRALARSAGGNEETVGFFLSQGWRAVAKEKEGGGEGERERGREKKERSRASFVKNLHGF